MNLRANPFIGEYTNEELQEWVAKLQDVAIRFEMQNDLLERINSNHDRIHGHTRQMAEIQKNMVRVLEEKVSLLQHTPIRRPALTELSVN